MARSALVEADDSGALRLGVNPRSNRNAVCAASWQNDANNPLIGSPLMVDPPTTLGVELGLFLTNSGARDLVAVPLGLRPL